MYEKTLLINNTNLRLMNEKISILAHPRREAKILVFIQNTSLTKIVEALQKIHLYHVVHISLVCKTLSINTYRTLGFYA